MLSNYTYSKYAINKGYNDDIKLLAPYYFELISNPRELETGYWEFEHCKVKLNSSYFNFTGGPTPPTPINYWEEVYADNKPFDTVDNRYYFVVWHGNINDDWKIIKFKYDKYEKNKVLDEYNNYKLQLFQTGTAGQGYWKDICLVDNNGMLRYFAWSFYPNYFKSVYRWNNNSEPNTPFISPKTGQITDWNLKQQTNVNNNKDNEIKAIIKTKIFQKILFIN